MVGKAIPGFDNELFENFILPFRNFKLLANNTF